MLINNTLFITGGNNKCGYIVLSYDILSHKIIRLSNFISEHYFQQLGQEIMLKVRERCQIIKLQSFNNQMFDDALQFVFDELNKRFISYKESNEFRELQEDINLYTFIQSKICNTGIINIF